MTADAERVAGCSGGFPAAFCTFITESGGVYFSGSGGGGWWRGKREENLPSSYLLPSMAK